MDIAYSYTDNFMSKSDNFLKDIISHFNIEGDVIGISKFGSGHINDTYRVDLENSATSFLLQRINHHVFPKIDVLMNNISLVTEHLRQLFLSLGKDPQKHTLTIVPCKDGKLYHEDEEHNYWRIFYLIEDVKSYDIVETPQQAFSAGQAFGQFQKQLSTLDAQQIEPVLPNFHNIDFRLSNLKKAIQEDKKGRVKEVEDLIQFIEQRENKMRTILDMGEKGLLPIRITHNDTKFNNVLLDENDNVQCVIDLDTVMPGYVAYDFGDAIRTIINPAAEDEKDLSKITLNLPLFQAYAEGYLSEAKDFLTKEEIESLFYGVLLLPYMQAVRFLTDYIDGDTYYKIHYIDHNLVRTRTQIKLVDELEKHEVELKNILNNFAPISIS